MVLIVSACRQSLQATVYCLLTTLSSRSGRGRRGRLRRVGRRVGLRVEGALLPGGLEVVDGVDQLLLDLVGERLLLADGVEDARLRGLDEALEVSLEAAHLIDGDVVELTARRRPEDKHLLLDTNRPVLRLLQNLDEALTPRELLLRRAVEVGAELRERRQLAVLREVEAERARHLLHRLDLRRAAHARHRVADVDGRAVARVEEVSLKEDLPVGDRDDVRRDVSRDVAGLRLDDGERRERARALRVGELGRTLKQARVQVEHVARESLATRRAPE